MDLVLYSSKQLIVETGFQHPKDFILPTSSSMKETSKKINCSQLVNPAVSNENIKNLVKEHVSIFITIKS